MSWWWRGLRRTGARRQRAGLVEVRSGERDREGLAHGCWQDWDVWACGYVTHCAYGAAAVLARPCGAQERACFGNSVSREELGPRRSWLLFLEVEPPDTNLRDSGARFQAAALLKNPPAGEGVPPWATAPRLTVFEKGVHYA